MKVPDKKRPIFDWEGSDSFWKGGFYGKNFWKDSTLDEELIKNSFNQAKDLLISMNLPFPITLQVSPEYDSSTFDGSSLRRVFVPSKILDNTKLSASERMEIFCGLTIHEGAHLLYTEYKSYLHWYRSLDDDFTLKRFLFNLFEDDRVETKLLDEKPGLYTFIEKMKSYSYFDSIWNKLKASFSRKPDWEKILNIVLFDIRCPKILLIEEKISDGFEEILNQLRPLYSGQTNSTQDSIEKVENFFLIFKELYPKLLDEDISDAFEDYEIIEQLLSGRDRDSGLYANSKFVSRSVSESLSAKELEGKISYGISKNSLFTIPTENHGGNRDEPYHLIKEQISPLIGPLRKALELNHKNFELIHRGCQTGVLDTNKLAEAYQGVNNVYIRKGEVKSKNLTVCILCDESGSMGELGRFRKARAAAVLANEAFGKIPGIDLYIYGHTADSSEAGGYGYTNLNIYKEANLLSLEETKNRLQRLSNRRENRDGVAYREVVYRIRKYTQDPILLIILSDGIPSAYGYHGEDAYEDTSNALKEIKKNKVIPIQINIQTHGETSIRKEFASSVRIDKISELPEVLGKIIKKEAIKLTKED